MKKMIRPIVGSLPTMLVGIESELNTQLILDEKTKKQLDKRIASFVHVILTMDVCSDKLNNYVDAIHTLGIKDIAKASEVSCRATEYSMSTLKSNRSTSKIVLNTLNELRVSIEMLDPSKQDDLLNPKKLFGLITLSVKSKLTKYFEKYELKQKELSLFIEILLKSKNDLNIGISTIQVEQEKLTALIQTLNGHIYVAEEAGNLLSENIKIIQKKDSDKAQLIINNLLPDLEKIIITLITKTLSALSKAKVSAMFICGKNLMLDRVNVLNSETSEFSTVIKNKIDVKKAGQELAGLKTCFDSVYMV